MKSKTLGFIGVGNMGSAFLQGLLSSKEQIFHQYALFDINTPILDPFAENKNVTICKSLKNVIEIAEYVILSVKPQVMASILQEIAKFDIKDTKFITIAAGLEIKFYHNYLGKKGFITRVMPNTPYLVGAGAAGITLDPKLDEEAKNIIKKIFQMNGKIILCNEKTLDVVTGLSGSGPAYFFVIAEALADGAVKMGLPRKDAYYLAAQTMLGSAKMLLETEKHPGVLKDMVTSPGGTTIEALSVLEENGIRCALIEAVAASTEKSRSFHMKD